MFFWTATSASALAANGLVKTLSSGVTNWISTLSRTPLTVIASLGQRLYPKMMFAQFASAWGLMFGVGYILTTPLMGLVLDASGHDYRLTFLAAGSIAALGVAAFVVSYKRFLRLGGHESYVPPEPG